jgi:uncharacterized protein with PQ loop repeat
MADVLALMQEGLSTLQSGRMPDASFLKALVSKVAGCRNKLLVCLQLEMMHVYSIDQKRLDMLIAALGYAIVAGASLLKVPQILGILNSGSAAGLNKASFELENIGFSIHTAYGFVLGLPFSAFGEAVIILLQNTFLLAIIYYYAKAPLWRGFLMILLTACGGWFVLSGDQIVCQAARKFDGLHAARVACCMQETPQRRWSCLLMSSTTSFSWQLVCRRFCLTTRYVHTIAVQAALFWFPTSLRPGPTPVFPPWSQL